MIIEVPQEPTLSDILPNYSKDVLQVKSTYNNYN